MLDQDTKRKIDNARDILVGKVPDPKSQVEQITIALIYKFMDDMDKESEEWGGKPTFFTGAYKKYAWSKIFDPRLGGFDLIALYGDAIVKMNQNPNIPQLFRDIFKNAYLPYRDPETLKSFLKEISEFTYDHSERLGDAFEYLLSVMDSQGDAGQFRTPRHIIDFIVEIVDPKKNETVLDPACGTAGFLISSYKHILKSNTKKHNGDQLTPDERKRLLNNFMGYDISPDMVRLSLVNLYLHGFSDPKIAEYDTLTSEERWNETADVMLANPPFMTPKGGIRPHKRFSIQAKRSEVLFVDYIAEHLNPNGRAGVIVPEGIIFQSAKAYKNLRKMLVENYLWAVVSLPAGVFQPYSGVKTSILLMDKTLTKKSDKILFVKIDSDGFNLGAQRRPIDKNDLPKALKFIKDSRKAIMDSKEVKETGFAHIVGKNQITESGNWNLSGERYRLIDKLRMSNFELIAIGDLCRLINGRAFKPKDWEKKESGGLPIIRIQNLNNPKAEFNYFTGEVSEKHLVKKGELLFSWSGSRGTSFGAHIWYSDNAVLNQHIFKVEFDESVIKKYLYYALNQAVAEIEENLHGGVGLVHITKGNLEKIQIPIPPLDIQKAIVAEIDGFQKIIDGARQVVGNYKPTIKIDPDWEMVKIKSVSRLITKGSSPRWQGVNYVSENEGILFITSENVGTNTLILKNKKYVEKKFNDIQQRSILKKGDILTNIVGASIGRTAIYDLEIEANINQAVCLLRIEESKIDRKFFAYYLNMSTFVHQMHGNQVENARANISMGVLGNLSVPLPPLPIQQEIVAKIESEQEIVNSNKRFIEMFEKKIKDKMAEVWGD